APHSLPRTALSRAEPRRCSEPEPGLEGHCAGASGRDGGHPGRHVQPGCLDGALPHRRAPRKRHDVHLPCTRERNGTMTTRNQTLDVLIIGAGQAGLALGYHLKQTPLRFQLVEGHRRIGDSWRKRYESLVLFTPRAYSALPGLQVSGDPDGYPTKDELADYLERYASQFALPVLTDTPIRRLERTDEGFRATTGSGETLD